ncbi:hypothetical protein PIIN_11831 [Serendipita indica DSM 11827]|uniref:tRNA-splicing endonuclease subunit Sen15 domain-containing protein n=1 Tax=Serendipita indica (strain DSM 11827) TaxID=1109443 RepID=G4T7K9_SERID|nr:hypothetical protein PIIN_11831 [Serendipita indica DSM 11827]
MEQPDYSDLNILCRKYPLHAGLLMQVYQDLLLSQRWTDIMCLDIHTLARPALMARGHAVGVDLILEEKARTGNEIPGSVSIVVPYAVDEQLDLNEIRLSFDSTAQMLRNCTIDSNQDGHNGRNSQHHKAYIFMAVVTSDSSQVYYKISDGIVKPQV